MTEINGMKIFALAMKLSPAVIGLFIVFNLYTNNWKEKRQITRILFQLIISASLGFAVFFAATWLWLRLKQGSNPEDLIPCIIAGTVGFYIGVLSRFLTDIIRNLKKQRKATQQQNRGDRE